MNNKVKDEKVEVIQRTLLGDYKYRKKYLLIRSKRGLVNTNASKKRKLFNEKEDIIIEETNELGGETMIKNEKIENEKLNVVKKAPLTPEEREKAKIKAQKEKEKEKAKLQAQKEKEKAKLQAQKEKEKARLQEQKEKEKEKAKLQAQKEIKKTKTDEAVQKEITSPKKQLTKEVIRNEEINDKTPVSKNIEKLRHKVEAQKLLDDGFIQESTEKAQNKEATLREKLVVVENKLKSETSDKIADELDETYNRLDKIETENNELLVKLNELKLENDNLKAENQKLTKTINEQKDEILLVDDLKNQLNSLNDVNEEIVNEKAKAIAKVKELEAENADLLSQIDEYEETINNNLKINQESQEKLVQLENENKQLTETNTKLQEENDSKEKILKQLEENLLLVKELEQTNNELTLKIAALEEKEHDFDNLNNELENYKDRVKVLEENNIDEFKVQIENLQFDNEELNNKLVEYQDKNTALESQLQEMKLDHNEIDQLKEENTNLIKQLNNHNEEILLVDDLKNQINSLNDVINEISNDKQEAIKKIENYEIENFDLQNRIDDLQKQVDELNEKISDKEKELANQDSLKENEAKTEIENQDLITKLEKTNEKIIKLEEVIADLNKKNEDMNSLLNANNLLIDENITLKSTISENDETIEKIKNLSNNLALVTQNLENVNEVLSNLEVDGIKVINNSKLEISEDLISYIKNIKEEKELFENEYMELSESINKKENKEVTTNINSEDVQTDVRDENNYNVTDEIKKIKDEIALIKKREISKLENNERVITSPNNQNEEILQRIKLLEQEIYQRDQQIMQMRDRYSNVDEQSIVDPEFKNKIRRIRDMKRELNTSFEDEKIYLNKSIYQVEQQIKQKKVEIDAAKAKVDNIEKEYSGQTDRTSLGREVYLNKKGTAVIELELFEEKLRRLTDEDLKSLQDRYSYLTESYNERIEQLNKSEADIISYYLNEMKSNLIKNDVNYNAKVEEKDYLVKQLNELNVAQQETQTTLMKNNMALSKAIETNKEIKAQLLIDKKENLEKNIKKLENDYKVKNDECNELIKKLNLVNQKYDERVKAKVGIESSDSTIIEYLQLKKDIDSYTKEYRDNIDEASAITEQLDNSTEATMDRTEMLHLRAKERDLDIINTDLLAKIEFFKKKLNFLANDEKIVYYTNLVNSIKEIETKGHEFNEYIEKLKTEIAQIVSETEKNKKDLLELE